MHASVSQVLGTSLTYRVSALIILFPSISATMMSFVSLAERLVTLYHEEGGFCLIKFYPCIHSSYFDVEHVVNCEFSSMCTKSLSS